MLVDRLTFPGEGIVEGVGLGASCALILLAFRNRDELPPPEVKKSSAFCALLCMRPL